MKLGKALSVLSWLFYLALVMAVISGAWRTGHLATGAMLLTVVAVPFLLTELGLRWASHVIERRAEGTDAEG